MLDGREAGIALLARRERRGWIGGMGAAPEARGRGLGRALMAAAIDKAKRAGLSAVRLEVIEQNHWAARIYEAIGFRDTRRLEVLVRPAGTFAPGPDRDPAEDLSLEDWLGVRDRWGAAELPWQRGAPVLRRQAAGARVSVRRGPGGIEAALLVRSDGARCLVLDAALAPGAAPSALESLIRAALAARPDATCSVLNLPAGDRAGDVFHALGFECRFVQREMALAL
jgi:predicted GNAT superfamily acetyltransferase